MDSDLLNVYGIELPVFVAEFSINAISTALQMQAKGFTPIPASNHLLSLILRLFVDQQITASVINAIRSNAEKPSK